MLQRARVEWEWWVLYKPRQWFENRAVWKLVDRIPRRVRYWIIMRAWADATSGPLYDNTEPTTLTVYEMVDRVFAKSER